MTGVVVAQVVVGVPVAAVLLHRHRRQQAQARREAMLRHPSNRLRLVRGDKR